MASSASNIETWQAAWQFAPAGSGGRKAIMTSTCRHLVEYVKRQARAINAGVRSSAAYARIGLTAGASARISVAARSRRVSGTREGSQAARRSAGAASYHGGGMATWRGEGIGGVRAHLLYKESSLAWRHKTWAGKRRAKRRNKSL